MYSGKRETFIKDLSGFEDFMGLCNILNKPHILNFISLDVICGLFCLCRWVHEFSTAK